MSLTFSEVLRQFDGVKQTSDSQAMARCPCHNDRKASLSIGKGDDGKVLLYCQAGCKTQDILSKIGLTFSDLMPEKRERSTKFDFKNVVATYVYCNGTRKLRDISKNFMWQHLENGKWIAKRGDAEHVLYTKGSVSDKIYICEGEKDTDNVAEKLNLYAGCSENGAGRNSGRKWFVNYNSTISGKDVVLLPDNDDVGRDFMDTIASAINNVANSVKVLDLKTIYPDLPPKGDITDVIIACGAERTRTLLEQVEHKSPYWMPKQTTLENADTDNAVAKVMSLLATKTIERKDGGIDTQVLNTSENYRLIFENDSHFQDVRYDLLKSAPVKVYGNQRVQWRDSNDSEARCYIEKCYGISSRSKYEDGLAVAMLNRPFHPVQERINAIQWDGQRRCETFFIRWMNAMDTTYTREASRLLFAGGIGRAYKAGCKFDSCVVLQDKQGSAKSTIIRWMALSDAFYVSIKSFVGKAAYETLNGKWIVEVEELIAAIANEHAGTRQEDNCKAFISSQSDYFRAAYGRRVEEHPRNNIFIGSTNREVFLSDKTGNRRWFPLKCNADSHFVYEHEGEIKRDIEQCWAEMLYYHKAGDAFASLTPRIELLNEIQQQQEDAEIDDERIGLIAEYVEGRKRICLYEIWRDVFYPNAAVIPKIPRSDSMDMASILVNHLKWKRGKTESFGNLGKQKSFYAPENSTDDAIKNLPY